MLYEGWGGTGVMPAPLTPLWRWGGCLALTWELRVVFPQVLKQGFVADGFRVFFSWQQNGKNGLVSLLAVN